MGLREVLEVSEQVRGRLGAGDARGDVGDVAPVALAQGEVRQLWPRGRRAQLIPQGHARHVDQVRVLGGGRLAQVEQGTDVGGVGVEAQRLGRRAAHERVAVLQAAQDEVVKRPVQLGALAQDAHGVDAHLARVIAGGGLEGRVVQLPPALEDPEGVHLPRGAGVRGEQFLQRHVQRPGSLQVRPVDQLIGGQDPDGQVGMVEVLDQVPFRGPRQVELARTSRASQASGPR